MVAIGPLVLIVVIGLVVYLATRSTRPPGPAAAHPVDALLARWTTAGLLSEDQAAAIARYEADATPSRPAAAAAGIAPTPASEASAPRRAPRVAVVAEALGYLGGILALSGLVLVIARSWPDLGAGARLALSGAAAVALVIAGHLVPRGDAALERLRGFAWLASSACVALFAAVLATDVLDATAPETITVAASAAVVAESGLLWRGRSLPLQELTTFGAVAVLVGSVVASMTGIGAAGIAVWITGGAFVAIGVRHLAPTAVIGDLVGGLAMSVGAMLTVVAWNETALPFAVVTAGVLLAAALVPGIAPDRGDQLTLGIVGGILGLQVVPGAIGYFAQDSGLTTGLAVWLVGLALSWLAVRQVLRLPVMVETVGAITMLVGAAVTATQYAGVGPVLGMATGAGLVVAGMLPGQGVLSVYGSAGLLVNVVWAITHFFPGEARAPLVVMVSGALVLLLAVMLTRSGRFRRLGPPSPKT